MELSLLLELDRLKTIERKSYITDGSRSENSAEHSWHLATALIAMQSHLPAELDLNKAVKLALLHDVCEIGAGDECAYYKREEQTQNEQRYLETLSRNHPEFGAVALASWQEYEAGITLEAQWVKVFDKLLPFLLNIANKGRTWKEQGITRGMVERHNAFMKQIAPDVHNWLLSELERAAQQGWLAVEG